MNGEFADERIGDTLRLDGNSGAGILSEVFVPDITTARATCANCGTTRALGALQSTDRTWGRDAVSDLRRRGLAHRAHAGARMARPHGREAGRHAECDGTFGRVTGANRPP